MAADTIHPFYVYVIRDPRPDKNNAPLYIGKGSKGRAKTWIVIDIKYIKNHVLRSIFAQCDKIGMARPVPEIIARFDTEAEALAHEIALIKEYGRRDLKTGTLCNVTDGGEGLAGNKAAGERGRRRFSDPAYQAQLAADPEVRAKRKAGLHRFLASPEGKAHTAKRTQRFIAGGKSHLRKWHASPEGKAEHAQRLARNLSDPEFLAKRTAGRLKYNRSPEGRAKLEQQWTNQEIRAKKSAGLRQYHARPEAKEKFRSDIKAKFLNGQKEWRESDKGKAQIAKQIEYLANSAEIKLKRAASMRAWWATPEGKARKAKEAEIMRARHARNRGEIE